MRLSRRCPATVVREARLLFPDNRIVSATNETADASRICAITAERCLDYVVHRRDARCALGDTVLVIGCDEVAVVAFLRMAFDRDRDFPFYLCLEPQQLLQLRVELRNLAVAFSGNMAQFNIERYSKENATFSQWVSAFGADVSNPASTRAFIGNVLRFMHADYIDFDAEWPSTSNSRKRPAVLGTIASTKGLTADCVFLFEPNQIPIFAVTEAFGSATGGDNGPDLDSVRSLAYNLTFVALTRTRRDVFYVSSNVLVSEEFSHSHIYPTRELFDQHRTLWKQDKDEAQKEAAAGANVAAAANVAAVTNAAAQKEPEPRKREEEEGDAAPNDQLQPKSRPPTMRKYINTGKRYAVGLQLQRMRDTILPFVREVSFQDEREAQATYVEHQQDRDIQDARDLAEQTHATYVAHQQDREVAFEDERNRAEQAQAQQAAYVQHLQDREARLQRDPERDAQRAVRRDAVRAVTKRSAPSGSASKSKKGNFDTV
jgi:hypothetical protein